MLFAAIALLLGACSTPVRHPVNAPAAPAAGDAFETVDPTTIDRKFLFGYQGWFGCPEDGSPLGRWEHWFRRGQPAGAAALRVDMWPDVSELAPGDRCPTPLALPGGQLAELYSAHTLAAVDMHFRWLREYDLPGVFLQRFTARLDHDDVRAFRDRVARNVRASAELHGRVFAVMFDISGHPAATLVEDVERDWKHVAETLRLTESRQYLRHRGKPVLAIWGLGFTDRPGTPGQAAELVGFFRDNTEPRYQVTLVGGVPAGWRTLTRDSQRDPRWAPVYRSFDAISPWSVGRFRDDDGMRRFYAEQVAGDLEETRRLGIGYMPVVFPGFSWHHMNPETSLNQIPRRGGRFLWSQVERALAAGSTTLYGAMFDEVDEGTAMFKVAADRQAAPAAVPTVTLDIDGVPVPNDWYLRLAREAQLKLMRRRP